MTSPVPGTQDTCQAQQAQAPALGELAAEDQGWGREEGQYKFEVTCG